MTVVFLQMSLCSRKIFTGILIVLLLLIAVGAVSAGGNYSASYQWDLQNSTYLNFNQTMSFSEIPHQGVSNDSSLVGYWNMNEGSGTLVQDLSGKGNNGTVNGAIWIAGKYGNALSFDGTKPDYVKVNNSISLQVTGDLTLSCWVYFNTLATKQALIFKSWGGEYELSMYGANGKLEFDHAATSVYSPSSSVQSKVWLHIIAVRNITAMNVTFYINGLQVGTPQAFTKLPTTSSNALYLGQENGYNSLNGTIDDVRIYNRALNASEITTLYAMGPNPDPASFANYYNFVNPVSNNTMLIHADAPLSNNGNSTLVTCTNFFSGKMLTLQANSSAKVTIWTNLGPPVFSTGVWNDQNYTTTLILDASSTGELNWNPNMPPYSSTFSMTSIMVTIDTTVSTLWTDNRSLTGGGFIFSTNNTGQWLNSSWVSFNLNPDWGNATLALNSTVGATVSFREYANNSLNLWGDSGIYSIKTTSLPVSTPTPTTTPTAAPLTTPTLSPTPVPTEKPIFIPHLSPSLSPTPNPTASKLTQIKLSLTEITLIAVMVIGILVAVFALAFRKGRLTIEASEDENLEESSHDSTT